RCGRAMTRYSRVVFAVVIAAACKGGAKQDAAEASAVGVGTAVAAREAFPQSINAIGTIGARPGRYAALAPPGPTRVARIFVVAGQRVARGDSLIEFERAPFDAAAQSAAAALANAERAYTDRKSTRLNSSHVAISYAVFCLKKKNKHLKRP